jgi:hypothetical protein
MKHKTQGIRMTSGWPPVPSVLYAIVTTDPGHFALIYENGYARVKWASGGGFDFGPGKTSFRTGPETLREILSDNMLGTTIPTAHMPPAINSAEDLEIWVESIGLSLDTTFTRIQ